jgi:uncharacterized iron-regulated protein
MPGRVAAEGAWVSPHYQDHPLAGTIWTSNIEPVTSSQFEKALSQARYVLLGETHNNPDHHRLQAQFIAKLAANGRRPAVVFEMVPTNMQGELDRHAQGGPSEASKLGKALRWEEQGWPDWAIYQPIAEVALSSKLPLLAGGLSDDVRKALAKSEPPLAYTQMMQELDLTQPPRPEVAEALGREISEAHCGLLPAAASERMIKVQRARDAYLAKTMLSANSSDGAVLIAGQGHARKDWAVPDILHRQSPEATIVSVAFIEVDPERTSASEYLQTVPGLAKPFDFIYLTPRADLIDRCAELGKQLERRKSQTPG